MIYISSDNGPLYIAFLIILPPGNTIYRSSHTAVTQVSASVEFSSSFLTESFTWKSDPIST